MHTTYNLVTGRLETVSVCDRHNAQGLHHVALRKGDVIVTDAGYPLGKSVPQGLAQEASGVHRFSAHQGRLEREDGKKIDLKRLVKHQKYATVCEYQAWVWEPKHKERFAIRVVISVAPRAQTMVARARKRAQIRDKKGPKASLAPAWWAGVMLIGTTLPKQTWSAQEVIMLYRAWWQIELFFKRLKQGLLLHWVPVKPWSRVRAYVHLCLLVWALQEQNAQNLCEEVAGLLKQPEVAVLMEVEEEVVSCGKVISHCGIAHCEMETLHALLRGSWIRQRLQDCLPHLLRYLVHRDRPGRPSQETTVQQWLLQRLSLLEKEPYAP